MRAYVIRVHGRRAHHSISDHRRKSFVTSSHRLRVVLTKNNARHACTYVYTRVYARHVARVSVYDVSNTSKTPTLSGTFDIDNTAYSRAEIRFE